MNNWVKVTSEEIKKGLEISKLKKGELQIQLAKALVKLDKINEYTKDCPSANWQEVCEDIQKIINEEEK